MSDRANAGERFLIFRTGQLGDMIATVPSIWAIRSQWPLAQLTLLCDISPHANYVGGAEIFRGSGLIEHFERYETASPNRIVSAWKKLKLLFRLRRQKFDALFYLAPSIRQPKQVGRDRRFFRAAGIRRIYGVNHFPPVPYNDPARPMPAAGHEADLLLARLKFDGVNVPMSGQGCLDIQLGATEESEVTEWLRHLPDDRGRKWIGVGPTSKMPAKRWELSRYVDVVRRLIEQFDVWPVVFGGAEDRKTGEELIRSWGRGFSAAGNLSVRGAASALGRCALFVGNDSGAMHLAAAAGTPCVAIFSSRDWPGSWYPYGVKQRVFRSDIECEGCYLVECVERHNECLKRISANEVLLACGAMLGNASRKSETLKI